MIFHSFLYVYQRVIEIFMGKSSTHGGFSSTPSLIEVKSLGAGRVTLHGSEHQPSIFGSKHLEMVVGYYNWLVVWEGHIKWATVHGVYLYIYIYIWLVVWNHGIWLDFPFSWECHHPNWRTHIFQRGRSTTNQISLPDFDVWTDQDLCVSLAFRLSGALGALYFMTVLSAFLGVVLPNLISQEPKNSWPGPVFC